MTDRNLREYVTFKDAHGNKVQIQQSSNACYEGTWLFITSDKGVETALNLTENQLRILIAGLQDRLDDIDG